MFRKPVLFLALTTGLAATPALAEVMLEKDMLLVRKLSNCAALMDVISDKAREKGDADMAGMALQSAGQFAMAARYYAQPTPAASVNANIASAREKIEYLHKMGGDEALSDDIYTCGSDALAKKGQEALDAQRKADENAAKKGE
jgi:hypothetical protein